LRLLQQRLDQLACASSIGNPSHRISQTLTLQATPAVVIGATSELQGARRQLAPAPLQQVDGRLGGASAYISTHGAAIELPKPGPAAALEQLMQLPKMVRHGIARALRAAHREQLQGHTAALNLLQALSKVTGPAWVGVQLNRIGLQLPQQRGQRLRR